MQIKTQLLLLLLSFSCIVLGQESSREYSRFYVDVDAGFGLWDVDAGNANTHFALGGGYRFSSQFAIGADYRS